MANDTNIIIKKSPEEIIAEEAARRDYVPLRIKCPDCLHIFSLYIKDFDQGLHAILGQACPKCHRFLTEKDDPEVLLVDLKEIRASIEKENTQCRQ